MRKFTTETSRFLASSKELANQIVELNEEDINEENLDSVQTKLTALQNQIAVLQYLTKQNDSALNSEKDEQPQLQKNIVVENFIEPSATSNAASTEDIKIMSSFSSSTIETSREKAAVLEHEIDGQDYKEENRIETGEQSGERNEEDQVQQAAEAIPESEKQALADQFMNKGIDNLGDHIGISEKFMFIHELFKGDTERYIKELNSLNNCTDSKKAVQNLEKLSDELSWDQETTAYLELKKLIDRKYPA